MTAGDSIAQRINTELGTPIASAGTDAIRAAAIGALRPQATVFPQDEEQVAAVLALANRERWSVVPWGSASSRPGTCAPTRYDIALSLTGLGKILDHDGDNLTLTAQSGLTLAEATRQIRSKHQFLPLGYPFERRTLGGMVAANRTPPQRLVYGDLRDQILGMRVATADGALVRYGRKVLKNVAGYDMNKLFLGSEGQLGVLVELTLKLAALPDTSGILIGSFSNPLSAFTCASRILRSPLQPSGIVILDATAATGFRLAQGLPAAAHKASVVVGFEGRNVTVKRQLADGANLMAHGGASATEAVESLLENAAEALNRPSAPGFDSTVVLRLGTAPTELSPIWESFGKDAEGDDNLAKVADYGSGQLLVAIGRLHPADGLGPRIQTLRSRLIAQRGYLVVQSAPPEMRSQISPWGDLGGEHRLMRALKSKLDPNGILSPGRYLG